MQDLSFTLQQRFSNTAVCGLSAMVGDAASQGTGVSQLWV